MILGFHRGRPVAFFDSCLFFLRFCKFWNNYKKLTKRKEWKLQETPTKAEEFRKSESLNTSPSLKFEVQLIFRAMCFTTLITQCLKPRLAILNKVSPEPSNYLIYCCIQRALQIFLHVFFSFPYVWSGSTLCALLHGTVLRWGIGKSSTWTLEWMQSSYLARLKTSILLNLSFNSFVTRRHAAITLQKAANKGLLKHGMFAKLWLAPEKFLRSFLKQLWDTMKMRNQKALQVSNIAKHLPHPDLK